MKYSFSGTLLYVDIARCNVRRTLLGACGDGVYDVTAQFSDVSATIATFILLLSFCTATTLTYSDELRKRFLVH